jgi:hypothetical protein
VVSRHVGISQVSNGDFPGKHQVYQATGCPDVTTTRTEAYRLFGLSFTGALPLPHQLHCLWGHADMTRDGELCARQNL